MSTRHCSVALAGCVQYAWWAHRIAQHGEYRMDRLARASQSILCTDPANLMDVYGGREGLKTGLEMTRALLGKRQMPGFSSAEAALITGYVGNLLRLATTLMNSREKLEQLGGGIAGIKADEPPEAGSPPIMALAKLYTDNISALAPRIMIQGNGIYLRNEEFAAGIRCHLLAALRSAVLWRQSGGRLWLLVFQRGAYLRALDSLPR